MQRTILAAAAVALLGLAACASVDAPAAPASLEPVATPVFEGSADVVGAPLAYPVEEAALITAVDVIFPPGSRTGWHRHDVPIFNYVLEGALTVEYEDGAVRTYSAGEAVVEAVGVAHWGRNDGEVPARLLSVVIGSEGVPYTVQLPDGP